MEVEIRIEKVYGINKMYPVNKAAKFFTALTGKKTFNTRELQVIRDLGFTITIKQPTLEELQEKGVDHVEH